MQSTLTSFYDFYQQVQLDVQTVFDFAKRSKTEEEKKVLCAALRAFGSFSMAIGAIGIVCALPLIGNNSLILLISSISLFVGGHDVFVLAKNQTNEVLESKSPHSSSIRWSFPNPLTAAISFIFRSLNSQPSAISKKSKAEKLTEGTWIPASFWIKYFHIG